MANKMRNRVTCVLTLGFTMVALCFACGENGNTQTPDYLGMGGMAGTSMPTGGTQTTGGATYTPTAGTTNTATGGAMNTATGGAMNTATGGTNSVTGGGSAVPTGGAISTGGTIPIAGTGGAVIGGDAAVITPDSAVVSDAAADAAVPVDAATDIPITGTFPPVTDPWSPGPYTAKTVELTGPAAGYTLYHPTELAPNGVPNPIITWGNGGATVPALYPMLPFFATHGFVVIAANSPMATGQLLSDGVDWLIEQNNDPSSEFYNKLDIDNIGAMGYSMGSLAVYEMVNYPNLVTTVHMSGGIISGSRDPVLNEPGPTAYFCDPSETKPNCDGDYAVVTVPVFYGTLLGANHVAMMLPPYSDQIAGAATAWFRWHLMADESQKSVFLGTDCKLCQDSAWTVQQKNW